MIRKIPDGLKQLNSLSGFEKYHFPLKKFDSYIDSKIDSLLPVLNGFYITQHNTSSCFPFFPTQGNTFNAIF